MYNIICQLEPDEGPAESCAGMDYYTLYIFNGYTLCKFTLSYTDYTYNILYNVTTSEYITSIIRITPC